MDITKALCGTLALLCFSISTVEGRQRHSLLDDVSSFKPQGPMLEVSGQDMEWGEVEIFEDYDQPPLERGLRTRVVPPLDLRNVRSLSNDQRLGAPRGNSDTVWTVVYEIFFGEMP